MSSGAFEPGASGTGDFADGGGEAPLEVLLNVYDVVSTPGDSRATVVRLNNVCRQMGLGGVFHGAIQVANSNVEFSFGWCERGTGVYAVHARLNPMYQFRETISLGSTPKSTPEIKQLIQELKAMWPGYSYDLLNRNCCHFCEEMARRLETQHPVPGWLNRFASSAAATVSATQETVRTMQDITSELGRLSNESVGFVKAGWAKTLAAVSQQQRQLAERVAQQQQQQQQSGGGGSAVAASMAASMAAAGQSLLVGFQQLRVGTRSLASQVSAAGGPHSASLQPAAAVRPQGGAQLQEAWPAEAAGRPQQPPPPLHQQQHQPQHQPQQHHQQEEAAPHDLGRVASGGMHVLPAPQPKLAPELCASGAGASVDADDPFAAVLDS